MGVVNYSINSNTIITDAYNAQTEIFPWIESKMWEWVQTINLPTYITMPQRMSVCTAKTSAYVGMNLQAFHPGRANGQDPISANYGVVISTANTDGRIWFDFYTGWSASTANNARGSWTSLTAPYQYWHNGNGLPSPTPNCRITYCADPGNRFFSFYGSYFGAWTVFELQRPTGMDAQFPPVSAGYGWAITTWWWEKPIGIGRVGVNRDDLWATSGSEYDGGRMRLGNTRSVTRYWPVSGATRLLGFLPPGVGLTGDQTVLNRIRAFGVDYTYTMNYLAVQTSDS